MSPRAPRIVSSLALPIALAALSGCTITTSPSSPSRTHGGGRASGRVAVSASGSAASSSNASNDSVSLGGSSGYVECHGGDNVVLQDRVIDTIGNGVEAHGGCNITLVRCTIRAGAVGVAAHGGSNVVLRDSVVEGRLAALELHGASNVALSNTKVRGRVEKHGGATLADSGGNSWQ